MRTENQIVLPGGRKIAYAEFGHPDGTPVLYFHGSPSSRMEPLLIGHETLTRLELRVIAPDRPGMGGSDFVRRRFIDWPADVVALADALRLDRFAVLGNSGGAPYVAACAATTPLTLFHGERDTNAPIAMVRRAVAQMPTARLVTYSDESHLSTLCNHMDEIARCLRQ